MATVAVSEISNQAAILRAELKEWERGFAAANGGKKAERGDIKKVPEIGTSNCAFRACSTSIRPLMAPQSSCQI
jgi:hypothetical protein